MTTGNGTKYTDVELEETRHAVAAIHATVCTARHDHDWKAAEHATRQARTVAALRKYLAATHGA